MVLSIRGEETVSGIRVKETGDHGSFNSWGRDRFWHPDYKVMEEMTANHPELILLDAVKTTTIRYNRFRCDRGWDIDLDDGSSNYHIYDNLCLNGGTMGIEDRLQHLYRFHSITDGPKEWNRHTFIGLRSRICEPISWRFHLIRRCRSCSKRRISQFPHG